MIIEDDVFLQLGEGDDHLTVMGVEVADRVWLDGQGGIDTLLDGGNNSFGRLQLRNFELFGLL